MMEEGEDILWTDSFMVCFCMSSFISFLQLMLIPSGYEILHRVSPSLILYGSLNAAASLLCLSDTSFCPLKRGVVKHQFQPGRVVV